MKFEVLLLLLLFIIIIIIIIILFLITITTRVIIITIINDNISTSDVTYNGCVKCTDNTDRYNGGPNRKSSHCDK